MNLLITEAAGECKGPKTNEGTQHPPCRAFMDDVTAMAEAEIAIRWLLKRLEELARWARLTFKPSKSRSLILRKGVPLKRSFKIQGEHIPTLADNPIKCLGKWYNSTLNERTQVQDTVTQLKTWFELIEKTTLPGKLKVWCYQFGIMPRLTFPFSLYDFPLTVVEQMERTASRFLRKWLGVPKSFSAVNLYSTSSPAALPTTALTEEFKVSQVRSALLLRHSKDQVAQGSEPKRPAGRKWTPQVSVNVAESRLRHSDIVEVVAEGRKGLGSYNTVQWSKANRETQRKMVVNEIRNAEEETRRVKAASMKAQGAWLNWTNVESRTVSSGDLMKSPDLSLSFFLKSISDTLPTPLNLHIWKKLEDPTCTVCRKDIASLRHILSSCKVALSEHRYTWRHNQVLKEVLNLLTELKDVTPKPPSYKQIKFVKEGHNETQSKVKSKRSVSFGILNSADDWNVQADIGKQLSIPRHIVDTNLRPDIVVTSESTKCIILIELTVPWEDRMDESHELKRAKYENILLEARLKGWTTHCYPIEVGCRGFTGRSTSRMFKELGMQARSIKRSCLSIANVAERCSRWLWLKRDCAWLPQKN